MMLIFHNALGRETIVITDLVNELMDIPKENELTYFFLSVHLSFSELDNHTFMNST